MRWSTETKLCAGMLFAFLLVVVGTVLSYYNSLRAIDTGQSCKRSLELLATLESVSAQLGFVSNMALECARTRDTQSLRRYKSVNQLLEPEIDLIKSVAVRDEQSYAHVLMLESLVSSLRNQTENLINRIVPGNHVDERFVFGELVKNARQHIKHIEEVEAAILKDKLASYEETTKVATATFSVLAVFVTIFFISLLYMLFRHLAITRRAVETEQRVLDEVWQRAPIGILKLNSDLIIQDVNNVFESYSGFKESALIGKPLDSVITDLSFSEVRQSVANRESYQTTGVRMRSMSSERAYDVYWDLAFWPVLQGGQIKYIIALVVDVSEKLSLSTQRDVFIQALTHDLKSPLIASNYLIQALTDNGNNLGERETELLNTMKSSNSDALRMVRNILEISKYKDGHQVVNHQTLKMEEVVASCVEELAALSTIRRVKVDCHFDPSLPLAYTDPASLRHLILNLLENAIKFSPPQSAVQVRGRSLGTRLELSVEDDGPGISEQDQRSIFLRFWQGDTGRKSAGGSGLGLYLCHQIVRAIGATIEYRNTADTPSTFLITIPCAPVTAGGLIKDAQKQNKTIASLAPEAP